jgi:hypothetical protein
MLKRLSTLTVTGVLAPSCISAALAASCIGAAQADPAADFKHGDLGAAEAGYAAALAAAPKDPGALLGLARVRLYQDRRADAERLAEAVPASDAGAAAAVRVIAEAKRRDAALDPANVVLPPGGVRVPFAATDPLPILKVRVNDKADAYFVLDTGASEAVLDPAFADELGIATEAAGSGVFAGGKTAQMRSATVDSLNLNGAVVRHVPVRVLPTRNFQLDNVHRLDGIIGTGILYRFLATIDYPRGELTLRSRDASAEFERSAAARGDVIVPMWLVGDHFIFARARLNDGPERIFNIDTGGAGAGVVPSTASMADSHVVLDTAHTTEGQGGGGSVKVVPFTAKVSVATLQRADVPGLYTPEGDQYGIFPFETGGSLSHLFFRPYALTFDFVAMKLVVDTPHSAS